MIDDLGWDGWWALGVLFALLLVSIFFSGSETAMNSINRYRLAHRARNGQRWAIHAVRLLHRPERLLGVILVGNNIANIAAAALVTLVATQMWGQNAVPIAGALLTLVILIFAEVVPKSLAAHRSEQIVRLVTEPLRFVSWVLWPLAGLVNRIAAVILRPFRLGAGAPSLALDERELRVLLETAGEMIPQAHLHTMLRVLGLSELTVADAMVPHTDIDGLDLEDDLKDILARLAATNHSLLPVYRRSIDEVVGFLRLHSLTGHLGPDGGIDKDVLEAALSPPVFVPEMTPLHVQLEQFRQNRYSMALVVDESGGVRGLLTLWDLVAEIIGDAEGEGARSKWQLAQDGSLVLEGTAQIREVNRDLGWNLPDDGGTRTLNGLILEKLEAIPHGNLCLELGDYRLQTLKLEERVVRRARVWQKEGTEAMPDPAAR